MRVLVTSITAILATGCATPVETAQHEELRQRCDTAVTGSNIPRCDRGTAKVMTRQDLERNGNFGTIERGGVTAPSAGQ